MFQVLPQIPKPYLLVISPVSARRINPTNCTSLYYYSTTRLYYTSTPTSSINHPISLSALESEPSTAMLHLDGSTLEGGGQLVRNAIALSAITSQPLKISRIRGGRAGKTGLRASHTAAAKFLLDVCGGEAEGAFQGSSELTFFPRGRAVAAGGGNGDGEGEGMGVRWDFLTTTVETLPFKSEYDIRLNTPGSVFLIFQALYPYLLFAGARANAGEDVVDSSAPLITLNITGGTNLTSSPSFDYFSQVLIPNFAKLGLPQLTAQVKGRGWCTGRVQLGTVSIGITPLETYRQNKRDVEESDHAKSKDKAFESATTNSTRIPTFPAIDLRGFERGDIIQFDVTVLAPDISLDHASSNESRKNHKSGRNKYSGGYGQQSHATPTSGEEGFAEEGDLSSPGLNEPKETRSAPHSIRRFVESCAMSTLSRELRRSDNTLKVNLHLSEGTRDPMHIYILLVAHTSTGFRIGRDALYGQKDIGSSSQKNKKPHGKKHKGQKRTFAPAKLNQADLETQIEDMVEECVADLMYEVNNEDKRYLDSFMRDQVVVFQALGKACEGQDTTSPDTSENSEEQKLSLHTRTAMWVCEEVLGVKV